MRQLFPAPDPGAEATEVVPLEAYDEPRPAPPGRPWVTVGMVASIDGATALDGRSGGLGGAGDRQVFRALRAAPDVVLVGAATARVEGYGPVRLDEEVQARRTRRGQSPLPRLALVSGRVDLDPESAMFREATEPPLVVTTEAGARDHAGRFGDRAELVAAGTDRVEPAVALRALGERGAAMVLVEGGPSLNGQLVAADLVDEWCQTLAPLLAAGGSARTAVGEAPATPVPMVLHRLLELDGELFGTWRRRQ